MPEMLPVSFEELLVVGRMVLSEVFLMVLASGVLVLPD
jgi:hypothetical protein